MNKDTTRTRRAAVLIAAGQKSDKEIAKELRMTPEALAVLKTTPMFQQLVSSYGEEIIEHGLTAVVNDLLRDAPKNIRFLKSVRDGDFADSKDRMDSRLRASKILFDKQAPNPEATVSDNAIQVVIGGKLMEQMLRALQRAGEEVSLDITPPPPPQVTEETDP